MVKVSLAYSPRPWFQPYHRRTQRFAHITAHRRCGKTVAAVRDMEKRALVCDLPDAKYAYIAPQLKQAKRNAWGYIKQGYYQLKPFGARIHESELHHTLPNGAKLQIFGANEPDALRGDYLDGVIIDEFATMPKADELWQDIILPMLSDRGGWATFIGSANGRNAFYNMRQYALAHQDEWFVDTLRVSETHAIPLKELQRLQEMMTDARYQREYECSFDVEGSKQLISAADISAALRRPPSTRGVRALGVDPARFGDDWAAFVGRLGSRLVAKRYSDTSIPTVTGHAYSMMQEFLPQAVFVDEVGLGGGVVDALRLLPYAGHVGIFGVNYQHKARDDIQFKDLKAQCAWDMREWVRRHGSLIDVPQQLIDELQIPEYDFDLKGRVVIESKDDIRERGLPSPDYFDALANTFAFPLMATDSDVELGYLKRPGRDELAAAPDDPFESLHLG